MVRRVPPGDTLQRWVCDQCGEIHYQNPKLIVGTVPEYEDKILLCRRAIEPRYGYWTLPAGFMENDETTGQAALRETLEESGARVELGAPFTMISVPRVNQVHLYYRARVREFGLSHLPMPWVPDHLRQWQALAGDDFWPYGIEPNRPTLEAFFQYAHEQGVAGKRLRMEDVFAPETREHFKI